MRSALNLIDGGSVKVEGRAIVIEDGKTRRNFLFIQLLLLVVVLNGAFGTYRKGIDFGDPLTWIYPLSMVLCLIVLGVMLRLKWESNLALDEVESARIKVGVNNANLTLLLKNGKRRRLYAHRRQEAAVRNFARTHFPPAKA